MWPSGGGAEPASSENIAIYHLCIVEASKCPFRVLAYFALVPFRSAFQHLPRRASKYILGDYTSDYKTRLIKLNLLPLMYIFELLDILFFIKSFKSPNSSFNISHYITFNNTSTRSGGKKLIHTTSNNLIQANSYFCRISRLLNALPIIDLACSPTTLKNKLFSFLWNHFLLNFDSNSNCSLHFLCPCSKCSKTPAISNFNIL